MLSIPWSSVPAGLVHRYDIHSVLEAKEHWNVCYRDASNVDLVIMFSNKWYNSLSFRDDSVLFRNGNFAF